MKLKSQLKNIRLRFVNNEYVQYQVTCMRQQINDRKGNQTLLRKRKKKGNFNTMNMPQSQN